MEYDPETGNYYDYARYYNPRLGRFMTPDPADLAAVNPANPQSWNRYAYVLNNPTSLIDPAGLGPCPPRALGCQGFIQGRINFLVETGSLGPVFSDPFDYIGIPVVTSKFELEPVGLWQAGPSFSGTTQSGPFQATSAFVTLQIESVSIPTGINGFELLDSVQREWSSISYKAGTVALESTVVAQDAARNFVSEFRNGGCVADFWDRVAGLPKYPRVGPQPQDVVQASGAVAWASYYALSGGTAGYNGFVGVAEATASYAAVFPLDYLAGIAFAGEMKDLFSGVCH